MSDILGRARQRRQIAQHLLAEVDLMAKWRRYGRPVVVGAVAYDLVVSRDIDIDVYCQGLRIEDGFEVLKQCALHPRVTKARFANELSGPDEALYWQVRYRHEDGAEWKTDMWSAPEDYALPRSEALVGPMKAALTDDIRRILLDLKERRAKDDSLVCPSIDLYRAVLDDGVHDEEELRTWLQGNEVGALTDWLPHKRLDPELERTLQRARKDVKERRGRFV